MVLDVDGVLTDGRIRLDHLGRETKVFHTKDGLAIRAWLETGREVAVITGRRSTALTYRLRELGVRHLIQGSRNKREALEWLVNRTGVPLDCTAAMGDDLNDLPVLAAVALPMTVADAAPEVRRRARYVTRAAGGQGAVREAIEQLLLLQGEWAGVVARFAEGRMDATPTLPSGDRATGPDASGTMVDSSAAPSRPTDPSAHG